MGVVMIPVSSTLVQRYAQRFVEGNMTAVVRLSRPDPGVFDHVDGSLDVASGQVVYEGKGRVYPVSGPLTLNLGDEPQYFSQAFVSVPLVDDVGDNVLPQVDDLVEVLEHPDPLSVGRLFRVTDVEAGGQFAVVRRMQVVGVQRFRSWTPDEQAAETSVPREWLV